MNTVEARTWTTLRAALLHLDPRREGLTIDAGAGIFDYYFEWLHTLGFRTAVIEPVPCEQVKELCANYQIPLIQAALDKRDGKAYLTEHPGGLYSLQTGYWGQVVSRREVATMTWQTARDRLHAGYVSALKLDIEGKEPDVLLQLTVDTAPQVLVFEFGGVTQRIEARGAWSDKARAALSQAYDHLQDIGYREGVMIVAGNGDAVRLLDREHTPERVFQDWDAWGNIVMTTAPLWASTLADWSRGEVTFG